MIKTASISELRERLSSYIDMLDQGGPVMVVRNSKPAGYLVSPEEYEHLMRCLEDYEDLRDTLPLWKEARSGKNTLPVKEVRKQLDL